MHQHLLNAEFASGVYRKAENKNMRVIRVMKALHKGVLAHAGKLLLHICLPSIAFFELNVHRLQKHEKEMHNKCILLFISPTVPHTPFQKTRGATDNAFLPFLH